MTGASVLAGTRVIKRVASRIPAWVPISVGGAMSRVALAAFLKCAREMKDKGSFTYVREMAPIAELRDAFAASR